MKQNLSSKMWPSTAEMIRKCHVGQLDGSVCAEDWKNTFDTLIETINDERRSYPEFAAELSNLDEETGFVYDFRDIFEEYFDHLESLEQWDCVAESAEKLINTFRWNAAVPSEYKYRIGNALQKVGKTAEAETFGKKWLEEYPHDYYAAASNAFLLIAEGKYDEASALTEKYLKKDLICDDKTNTFFMAANALFEITQDSNAKKRIEEKIEEYEKMIAEKA